MKYIIETTENGVNETLEVDGNLYKTSHISNCPYCGRFLTENYS